MKHWIVTDKNTGAVLREGMTIDDDEIIYCAEGEELAEEISDGDIT